MADQTIQEQLRDLVMAYRALEPRREDPEVVVRLRPVIDNIRLIGKTAAFCGGLEAMYRLHDAAEELVHKDNSVGWYLNRLWDGIGGWLA